MAVSDSRKFDLHCTGAIAGAFVALCVSWMVVLPLFSGPDEPANFIKSAAVIRGELFGEPIEASASTSFWSTYVDIDSRFGTAQQVPWCFVGQPQTPACSKPLSSLTPVENSRTDMGRYPALGFLPAGVGTILGPSDAGVRAARVTSALAACTLLTIAAELLRRRKRSITALLVAASPGVLFLSSVSSPSGLEISAAIAAWAATWIAISEEWRKGSTINVFVVTASFLVMARPAGVVTVALMIMTAMLADSRAVISAMRTAWQRFVWLFAALFTSGAWYLSVYDDNFGVQLEIESRVSKLSTITSRSLSDLPRLIGESIGNFGWLDTPSPTIVVWGFVSATVALLWNTASNVAFRQRAALALVTVTVPIWHVALNVNYQELLGSFGAQGRHLTPFIVGIPLAATIRQSPRKSSPAIFVLFVVAHAWCVLVALRRYSYGAGGDDLLGFIRNPAWTPVLGIPLTLVVVAVTHLLALLAMRYQAGRMER